MVSIFLMRMPVELQSEEFSHQIQDGAERVICYGSRICSPAEQNYDVTKRELLAIVYFLKTYRPYLLGGSFYSAQTILHYSGYGRPLSPSDNRLDCSL